MKHYSLTFYSAGLLQMPRQSQFVPQRAVALMHEHNRPGVPVLAHRSVPGLHRHPESEGCLSMLACCPGDSGVDWMALLSLTIFSFFPSDIV